MSRNGFPPVAWWQAAKSIGLAPWPNASRTTWPTPASLSGLGRMIGGRASKTSESRTWGCLASPVRLAMAIAARTPSRRRAR